MRKLAFAMVLAAAAGAAPRPAQAQNVVTCESHGGRRQTCSVDTRGGVRLVRRLSDNPCVQGRSWGTTSRGVWVDDGCRAQFAAGGGRGGSYGYPTRGRHGNGGYGNGGDGNGGSGNGNGGYGNGGYGNGGYGNGGYGNGGYGRNDDYRGGRVDGSRAIALCRQAVRREIGNRRLDIWLQGQDRNNARVEWRADQRLEGTCRVDRNGRVDVRVSRQR